MAGRSCVRDARAWWIASWRAMASARLAAPGRHGTDSRARCDSSTVDTKSLRARWPVVTPKVVEDLQRSGLTLHNINFNKSAADLWDAVVAEASNFRELAKLEYFRAQDTHTGSPSPPAKGIPLR